MTKNEFLTQLMNELNKNDVADTADIISEYEQHFAFKIADGYSEAEIAAKLGTPVDLAAQFESWIDPLAIMFSLPLAIIGAMIALFVSGAGLSMVGMIGIIFLLGLVTKNAILLVDFIKKRREEGLDRRESIMEAGMIRLKPIMMTTLAMIFGMLPSAIDMSTGSEMRQPMAIAIIGGLISSTLLTLLVIPVIYTVLDDLKVTLRFMRKL